MRLETRRLILREFRAGDLDAVHAYGSDPEVVRFMPWGPNTPEETRRFLQRKFDEQAADPRPTYDVAVVERASGRVIGSVGLRLNAERTQAALGYCYARHAWGRGIATEAAWAMLRFGFEELGLDRIHATCDAQNIGSARVLEKIGMRREGHRIEDILQDGRWRDTLAYAILAREWRSYQEAQMSDDRAQMLDVLQAEWISRREGTRMDIPEGVGVKMNVPYGVGGDTELTLDLFLPPADFAAPRPAILFIHGGGWQGGTPAQFYRQAARLALKGVIGACCRYRFSDVANFPAAVHDVKAALRWLRSAAGELNLDVRRVGAVGGSSGGHLAAMLATTAGIPELEGEGGNAGERTDLQLCVPLNPITDMRRFVEGTDLHPAAVKFMGGTPDELPDAYALASPLLHIDENTPPCLLVHGTGDTLVPQEQSTLFADAMHEHGLRAELVLVEGQPHGFFNQDPHFEPIYAEVERFVLDVLGL